MLNSMIKCRNSKYSLIVLLLIALMGCTNPQQSVESVPNLQTNKNVHCRVEFSPSQNSTKLIVDNVNAANKSIYVAAYALTSAPIAESLIAAHQRGIKVAVLLDRTQAASKDSKYNKLKRSGVRVRLSKKYKIMHNKYMVFDESAVQTGSFNYTLNAEKYNAENVIVIYNDQNLAKQYLSTWHKMWHAAK